MKKQIKRVNHEFFDQFSNEKITFHPLCYGELDLQLKDEFRWPKLSNIVFANGTLHPQHGLIGEILTAKAVLGQPWAAPIDTESTNASSQKPANTEVTI
jgi:hypothetical protein